VVFVHRLTRTCAVRKDPSPLASAKGSRHNYRLYRARSVNPGPIPPRTVDSLGLRLW